MGAIGPTADMIERASALVSAHVDVLVIDTAHGHTKNVLEAITKLRLNFRKSMSLQEILQAQKLRGFD